MSTKRSRRWNGTLQTLDTDFLKDVIEKMESYGDQVQFEFPGKAQRPHYQVITKTGRKMGFDSKNLLLSLNENGNISDELSSVFSIEAIRAAAKGLATRTAAGTTPVRSARSAAATRGAGSASRSAAVAQAVDTVEHDKYAYFKANRDALPEDIAKHSTRISELMRGGMSAEEAFETVIKDHYNEA
ncbi:hypothetical protein G5B35_09225 [Parapusillimonas sp. SGNA-6]|nr:hypothetical protein [Parapusillimonas sp. SGNA-6]